MHVVRGRADSVEADRQVTADLVAATADTGERGLRVWTPPPHVAFGRRDTNCAGYQEARTAARDQGYAPVEREVGGRAVAFTEGTLSFVLAEPIEGDRGGIDERYERVLDQLEAALDDLGVEARRGEPSDAFCPGSHSLQADGKIAGLAQRIRSDVAAVGGVLVVRDPSTVAAILDPVYDALGVQFDPDAVGSVAAAGGPADVDEVAGVVEQPLAGDVSTRFDPVREV